MYVTSPNRKATLTPQSSSLFLQRTGVRASHLLHFMTPSPEAMLLYFVGPKQTDMLHMLRDNPDSRNPHKLHRALSSSPWKNLSTAFATNIPSCIHSALSFASSASLFSTAPFSTRISSCLLTIFSSNSICPWVVNNLLGMYTPCTSVWSVVPQTWTSVSASSNSDFACEGGSTT